MTWDWLEVLEWHNDAVELNLEEWKMRMMTSGFQNIR